MDELTGELAAWLLFAFCLLLPLAFKKISSQPTVLIFIWLGLFLRMLNAVYNAHFGESFGADLDANHFQEMAAEMAQSGDYWTDFRLGTSTYVVFLAAIYQYIGLSHLLGEMISIFAFLLAVFFLNGLIDLTKQDRYRNWILGIFIFWPTSILFTSITLREPYQIVFYMAGIYSLIRFQLSGNWISFFCFIFSFCCMSFWHTGFTAYMPVIIILAMLWPVAWNRSNRWYRVSIRRLLILFILVVGVWKGVQMLPKASEASSLGTLNKLASGDAASFISKYRGSQAAGGGRTTYGATFDPTSPATMAASLPGVFFLYMFAPLPWQIGALVDVYACLEGLIRLIAFLGALQIILSAQRRKQNPSAFFLWVNYASLSLLWSLGTMNFGTSMRHHLVGFGVLLVLGLPPAIRFFSFRKKRSAQYSAQNFQNWKPHFV